MNQFYKKYNTPIFLFLILEKINSTFWTSETNLPNHFFFFIPKNYAYILAQILHKEYFFSQSYLVEVSAIDSNYLKNQNIFLNFKNNFNCNLIVFYTYYAVFLKSRLTFFFLQNSYTKQITLNSIDKIYRNANWAEREASEMYNINYTWKSDTRKLLIDYSKNEYPLLKDYPSEGFQDVHFNFFEGQVTTIKTETVEL